MKNKFNSQSQNQLLSIKRIKLSSRVLLFSIMSVLLLINCATREFRKSVAKDSFVSKDPELQKKLNRVKELLNEGNREFQIGNFSKSAEVGEKANHIYPVAEAYYLVGASYFKLDIHDKAIVALEDGLRIAPENEQIGLTYAMVLTSRGEDEKALEVYDGLIPRFPEEKLYLFKKGSILKSLKRYADAYSFLKMAAPKAKDKNTTFAVQLYMQLGDVALQLKKFDEAEEYFNKAKSINPELEAAGKSQSATTVAKLLDKGNDAIKNKNYPEAIKNFKEAIEQSEKPAAPYVFLGNAYMLSGNADLAEDAFKKAIAANDHFKEGYSSLATLYYKNHDYSKSKSIIGAAMQLFPKDAVLNNKMGLVLKALGDLKVAIIHFSKALEYDSAYNEARVNMVYQLIELGRYREARKEIAFLKENQAEIKKLIDVAEEISKGDALLREGKVAGALEKFKKAREIDRKEPSVYNAFGRAYFINKDFNNSEKSFKSTLEIDKENIPAIQGLVRLYGKFNKKANEKKYKTILKTVAAGDPLTAILAGRELEDEEKYNDALKEYLKILKNSPGNEAAKFRIGIVYYKMALEANNKDNYEVALKFLDQAKEYNSDIPEMSATERNIRDNKKFEKIIPLVRKANALYDSGKYENAITIYKTAYEKSNKISLMVKIAEAYLAMGEEEKGVSILKNASALKGSEYDVKEAINAYLLKKGEVSKAESGFLEILQEKPDSYYSNYQLGLIQLIKKNYDEAIELFDRSIIFNSSYIPAIAGRGIAYYKKGKKSQAIEEFKEAVKKDETLEVAPFNIGMVYYNDKKFDQAKTIFHDLIKKYPDFADSYYHLSYIHYYNGDMKNAEVNINKAIALNRKADYLYAYLKILEELSKRNPNPSYQAKLLDLSKELTERFPSSEYAKKARKNMIASSPDSVIVQSYNLKSSLVTSPFILNGKMVLNYGTSIVLVDKVEKKILWKLEIQKPFSDLSSSSRLYGISNKSIKEIDMFDGKLVNSYELNYSPAKVYAYNDYVIVKGKTSQYSIVSVFDSNLKLTMEKKFPKDSIITLDESGNIYVMQLADKEISFNVSNASFKNIAVGKLKNNNSNLKAVARLQESILVYIAGNYFEVMQGAVLHKINFSEKTKEIWSVDNTAFFTTSKGVYKLISGEKTPEKITNSDYAFLAGNKLINIDKDGKVELNKDSGQNIWQGSLNKYKSTGKQEIYSIIYQ